MAFRDFWHLISGKRVLPRPTPGFAAVLTEVDDLEMAPPDEAAFGAVPEWGFQSVTGLTFILRYKDSKGQETQRRITCKRFEVLAGKPYLAAYCFERQAFRSFRADRIVELTDLSTGEIFAGPTEFMAAFGPDRESVSPFRFGLRPKQFGDLSAGLNVLAFIARCDKRWHTSEGEAIGRFAASFWMRSELEVDLVEEEVVAHSERLSPDAEVFFVAIERCIANPVLALILRRHVDDVILADGLIAPAERHYREALEAAFIEAGL